MITIDEYSIKKHIFETFIVLMLGMIAYVYVQGDAIFSRFFPNQSYETTREYTNSAYEFSFDYPLGYSVVEHDSDVSFQVLLLPENRNSAYSVSVDVFAGDRNTYISHIEVREKKDIVSKRNITIGDHIFAKQISYNFVNDDLEKVRVTETVASKHGFLYVMRKEGDSSKITYPLMLQSFTF